MRIGFDLKTQMLIASLMLAFGQYAHGLSETYSSVKTNFVSVKNTRLAYRRYGSANGTPLVLLLSTRANMDLWDPLLLDRLAQNRTVIAFDNKGVGDTSGTAPDNFAAMADDAADFITALGYKKVDILGFSIGGAVAQELLIRHNGLVRRAILAGTGAKGGDGVNEIPEKSKSVSTKPSLTDDDFLCGLFAPSDRSQALGRQYLQRMKQRVRDPDEPVSMATVRAQAIAREEWGRPREKPDERLKTITNPVLISNGINDIRMPTINSYRLSQILPYSQLILYPDSGHGFLFQYPDVCGKAFADFLDQTLSSVSNTEGEIEMRTAVQLFEEYTRRVQKETSRRPSNCSLPMPSSSFRISHPLVSGGIL